MTYFWYHGIKIDKKTDPELILPSMESGLIQPEDVAEAPKATPVEDPARKTWERWQERVRRDKIRKGEVYEL
ncbi:hypothetical protein AYO40_01140 [Planctomycetaceae bacterium SCGC AG-212-D15]|nr:hypothetical protein AYO40_01140 [Planctomycetaceae bacterium SCGC AG-212-D15]